MYISVSSIYAYSVSHRHQLGIVHRRCPQPSRREQPLPSEVGRTAAAELPPPAAPPVVRECPRVRVGYIQAIPMVPSRLLLDGGVVAASSALASPGQKSGGGQDKAGPGRAGRGERRKQEGMKKKKGKPFQALGGGEGGTKKKARVRRGEM